LAVALIGVSAACRIGYDELDIATLESIGKSGAGAADAAGGNAAGGDAGGGEVVIGDAGGGGASATAAGGDAGETSGSGTGGSSGSGTGGSSGAGSGGASGAGSGGTNGAGSCVPDASCSCEVYLGHGYRFCTTEVTYDAGRAACQAANMGLVRVDDAAENAWLLQQFTNHGMFLAVSAPLVLLGGDDISVEGTWRWADGTVFWTGGAAAGNLYNNWAVTPRVGGVSDCLGMRDDGGWIDRACNSGAVTVACESL
jgi:Lectin C-type domain